MTHFSPEARIAVSDLASRYNISTEAVEHMLIAVNNGNGRMAQFNCPELGGSGQWMRGGMIMVGDMFNHGLKSTVDSLCNELSNLLTSIRIFPDVSAGTPGSQQWWPTDLGAPTSSGSQNSTRYAVFNRRLAVEVNGQVTVYDTLDHQIGGVSQQQGSNCSLTFSSQYGTLLVSTLPIVSGEGISLSSESNFAAEPTRNTAGEDFTALDSATSAVAASPNSVRPEPHGRTTDVKSPMRAQMDVSDSDNNSDGHSGNHSGNEIIALIEKLAQLHSAGVLDDEEFSAKKQELLARL